MGQRLGKIFLGTSKIVLGMFWLKQNVEKTYSWLVTDVNPRVGNREDRPRGFYRGRARGQTLSAGPEVGARVQHFFHIKLLFLLSIKL